MPTLPNPRVVVVVVILLIIIFYPSAPSSTFVEKQNKTSISKQRHAVRVLDNSTWDTFGGADDKAGRSLDLIGLRSNDSYSWPLLSEAKQVAKAQLQYAMGEEGLNISEGLSNISLSQYHNVTGWLRGKWVRSKLAKDFIPPTLDLEAIVPDVSYANVHYERNITGTGGKLRIKLDQSDARVSEQKNQTVAGLSAVITIQDETSSGDGWEATLYGYHIPSLGSSVLTTSSEKFSGVFALPHFSLTQHFFQLSKLHMNGTLTEIIEKQEAELDSVAKSSWSSHSGPEEPSSPRCELIIYLQQSPVHYALPRRVLAQASHNLNGLDLLEQELRYPSGGFFPEPPKLQMYMTAFSPDCGFLLESSGPPNQTAQAGLHLQGHKIEIYITQGKRSIAALAVLLFLQLVLLVRQMRASITPAARSRLSFHTISILSLGSAFVWVAFMVIATVDDSMYLIMMAVAFFAFLAGSFFGMKFLLDIWNAQAPEQNEWQQRQEQNQQAQATSSNSTSTQAQPQADNESSRPPEVAINVSTPANVASRISGAGAIPFMESIGQATPQEQQDQARVMRPTRSSFGAQYTRFYLLLVTLFFLSIHASSAWPPRLRSIYANLLVMSYLSFWVPQIHRNIIRNCRKALTWTFVVGQSVLSILPFLYFWGVEDNILFVDTNRHVLVVFASWLWIQILVLVGQEIIGPRFFVSEKWKWVPPAWDYHPILREDEEGAAMPVGLTSPTPLGEEPGPSSMMGSKTAPAKDKGKKVFDCAICMQDIEVPVVPSARDAAGEGLSSSIGTGLLARRAYMVTPCRHIFHTSCLEAWIGYRLQCPNCRESLPPL